ncbi:hypothetical protein [Legionella waltersii]|uniref:Uncharacterized protein n=1 Tax=Legionella waltersii TaxID=66969 RepID=A0A0W1ANR3_9GAMM|nr:hypothetical protein [Legionella waltersii]KTD82964.1 hypothetical protein Lwal_0183 [Legionella waltersii]SNU97284.1 Uncharacterised protein [Legionella waltersii]
MTLILRKKKIKFLAKDQSIAFIKDAVNVSMDEVVYLKGKNKTVITDGLATCAAVAFYGMNSDCSSAFTHMSNEASEKDDQRKEKILNDMLAFVLKNNSRLDVRLVISPSSIQDEHLISFISKWVVQKKLACRILDKGGDSAVFDIDKNGCVLMLSTSLNLKQNAFDKRWEGHGVVIDQTEGNIPIEMQKKRQTFFKEELLSKPLTTSRAHPFISNQLVVVGA